MVNVWMEQKMSSVFRRKKRTTPLCVGDWVYWDTWANKTPVQILSIDILREELVTTRLDVHGRRERWSQSTSDYWIVVKNQLLPPEFDLDDMELAQIIMDEIEEERKNGKGPLAQIRGDMK